MKMSGKSDFLFSLELASSTIGLHNGKSCFGVLNANYPFTYKRCMKRGWLPWQRKFFSPFFPRLWPCVPPRIFKMLFLKMYVF